MKIKIKRVWDGELDKYKGILDKYNASFEEDEPFAIIQVNDVKELFSLAKELGRDLIIGHFYENQIDIYDDYIE
jgi:hypothetical protein